MKKSFLILAALLAGSFSLSVSAEQSSRTNKWETGLIFNYIDDWEMSGRSGSNIKVDGDEGWGFSIGYNFNEHFNFAFEFIHNNQHYDATIVPDTILAIPFEVSYKLTNDVYNFNFTYNILETKLTPFVSAGVGWTYLDSNISSTDEDVICWWDPWWGYVCDDFYSTYADTSFSYDVGGGLRWDIGQNFVLKASVHRKWLDVDAVGDTPTMLFSNLEFAWMMY